MYTRDFGGIKSDGTLYELEREYSSPPPPPPQSPAPPEQKAPFGLDILRGMSTEEMLRIAAAFLLLFGKEGDNSLFFLILAAMLLL